MTPGPVVFLSVPHGGAAGNVLRTGLIGRLIDALKDLEILDDTLIYLIIGDNGASAEGTPNGCFNEMAVLKPDSFRTMTTDDVIVSTVVESLEHKLEAYELGKFDHYMLKEIHEQPNAISNCLRGRAEAREGRWGRVALWVIAVVVVIAGLKLVF